MRRQQVLTLVNVDPVVVDQTAGGGDRKVRWNLRGDLLESQHTIQLAIDPETSARTNDSTSARVRQTQTQG